MRCRFPSFKPILGYAVTRQIRSSFPPMAGRCYFDRMDFRSCLATLPEPRVIVLKDSDPPPGFGAFVGEVHATIGLALNCIGYVTSGAVREEAAKNLSSEEELKSFCRSPKFSLTNLAEKFKHAATDCL